MGPAIGARYAQRDVRSRPEARGSGSGSKVRQVRYTSLAPQVAIDGETAVAALAFHPFRDRIEPLKVLFYPSANRRICLTFCPSPAISGATRRPLGCRLRISTKGSSAMKALM